MLGTFPPEIVGEVFKRCDKQTLCNLRESGLHSGWKWFIDLLIFDKIQIVDTTSLNGLFPKSIRFCVDGLQIAVTSDWVFVCLADLYDLEKKKQWIKEIKYHYFFNHPREGIKIGDVQLFLSSLKRLDFLDLDGLCPQLDINCQVDRLILHYCPVTLTGTMSSLTIHSLKKQYVDILGWHLPQLEDLTVSKDVRFFCTDQDKHQKPLQEKFPKLKRLNWGDFALVYR